MKDTPMRGVSVIGITHLADVRTAAELMEKKNISALGVYSNDGHELLGIVTERNITRSVGRGLDARSTRVEDIMGATPAVLGPISREEALSLMRSGHVRHLIVHEDGADKMLSIRDLGDR